MCIDSDVKDLLKVYTDYKPVLAQQWNGIDNKTTAGDYRHTLVRF